MSDGISAELLQPGTLVVVRDYLSRLLKSDTASMPPPGWNARIVTHARGTDRLSLFLTNLRQRRFRQHGSADLRITVVGHSDVDPIMRAAALGGDEIRCINFWNAPPPAISEDWSALHPGIEESIRNGAVFSAVGGAVHYIMGLVEHAQPYDFVHPDRRYSPVLPNVTLVPYGAIVETIKEQLEPYLSIIETLRRTAGRRIHHLAAPPPSADNIRLEADMDWSIFYSDSMRRLAPPHLRLKLWSIANQLTHELCDKIDVNFVEPPAEATGSSGYLDDRFYGDGIHPNDDYGAIVLKQIRYLAVNSKSRIIG